jgi:hypothetical protein
MSAELAYYPYSRTRLRLGDIIARNPVICLPQLLQYAWPGRIRCPTAIAEHSPSTLGNYSSKIISEKVPGL